MLYLTGLSELIVINVSKYVFLIIMYCNTNFQSICYKFNKSLVKFWIYTLYMFRTFLQTYFQIITIPILLSGHEIHLFGTVNSLCQAIINRHAKLIYHRNINTLIISRKLASDFKTSDANFSLKAVIISSDCYISWIFLKTYAREAMQFQHYLTMFIVLSFMFHFQQSWSCIISGIILNL